MSLKDIKSLRKVVTKEKKEKFVRYLIVGHDIFSVILYHRLLKMFGGDEVQLVSSRNIVPDDLVERGPTSLRGEINLEKISEIFPNLLQKQTEPPVYFKDQKFKSFTGRGQPEELLWGESFYTKIGARVDLSPLCDFANSEMLQETLSSVFVATISEITKTTPTELLENSNYVIKFTDGSRIGCEKLIWGVAPHRFLFHYLHKNELPSSFIAYCDSTMTRSSINMTFVSPRCVSDQESTVFIPQSYTHPHGHFIGEFLPSVPGDGQRIEFLTFVDSEVCTEDEITKKIRALKRALEKIYPDFRSAEVADFISFKEQSPPELIDDSLFEMDQMPHLLLLGNAALLSTKMDISHVARAICSLHELTVKFSKINESISKI